MPTTVWDAAMDAVAARLRARLPDVTLHVDRRSDVGEEERPCLVLVQGSTPAPDLEQDPGAEHHNIEILVAGYAAPGDCDTAARVAVNTLRAQVHAALNGYAQGAVFDVIATGGEGAQLYETEKSALPAGEFVQPFTVRCVTPSGHPYAS